LAVALANAPHDSVRVEVHNAMSKQYSLFDVFKATEHAKAAEKLAASITYLPGLATALNQQGRLLIILGEYDKSLKTLYRALKVSQQVEDTALLVSSYTNLAVICNKTKDEDKALRFYAIAQELARKSGNALALSKIFNGLGHIHAQKEAYGTSLEYFKKAAQLQERGVEKRSYAVILQNIGEVYTKLNQLEKGREYLYRALAIDEEIQNKMNLPVTLGNLALSYVAENKYPKALEYGLKSYTAAFETGSSKKISAASQLLNQIYAALDNYERAYFYLSIYNEHQAKLNLEKQNGIAAEATARFENERLDLETKTLKAEKEKQALTLKHQKLLLIMGMVAVFLLLFLVVELFLRRKYLKNTNWQLQQASDQVFAQNREIKRQKEEIVLQAGVLQRQNKELEKNNNFKRKIFSIVSHDLRSPFTTLQGIMALAKDDKLTEQDMKRIFSLLDKDVEVIMEMLNNLLVWSKNQINGSGLHVQPVNVRLLADECVQVVLPKAEQKNLLIENSIDQDHLVYADRESIAFVLRNLVVNAIKFSYPGEKVSIRAIAQENEVKLAVVDAGKGISSKNMGKLFTNQRFTTLGTSKEVGTGLGLMLCKELLESQNGAIAVESEEGKGTTFIVSLPPAVVAAPAEEPELMLAFA